MFVIKAMHRTLNQSVASCPSSWVKMLTYSNVYSRSLLLQALKKHYCWVDWAQQNVAEDCAGNLAMRSLHERTESGLGVSSATFNQV